MNPMGSLEVLDSRGAPEIEQVLSCSTIASTSALARGDVSERMLDGHAGAKSLAAGACGLESAETFLKGFVRRDRHATSAAARGLGTASSKLTGATDFRIEVDGGPGLE